MADIFTLIDEYKGLMDEKDRLKDATTENNKELEKKRNELAQAMPEPAAQEEAPPELLENGLAEEQTAPDPYPYIIVRIADGEIKDENSAQDANVTLLFGIYEPDYDKQGHKDILNIIAKIYERFAKYPVLNGKYTIQYPILWTLQDEESYPFYFGGMNLTFEIARKVRTLS